MSVDKIKKFIFEMCEETALINGQKARGKIKNFISHSGFTEKEIKNFWQRPGKALGPFNELPPEVKKSLAEAGHFHIRESHFLTSDLLLKIARGPLFKVGRSLVHMGWIIKDKRSVTLGNWLTFLGRVIIFECQVFGKLFLKFFRFTRLYKAPLMHMLWHYAGVNIETLVQDYIQNIPVDADSCPVFIQKRNVTGCGMVGIDLLCSNGKLVFAESNFNAGHIMERHRLFPEGDTVFRHLIAWAAENGYSNIVFYPTNFYQPVGIELERAWQKMAQDKGLGLEIIDDFKIGSPWPRKTGPFIENIKKNTLIINGRYLGGPLSSLIGSKGLLEREIQSYNSSVPDDKKIPVPMRILDNSQVPYTDEKKRFPNIIVKNSHVDQAKGICLYKSKTLPGHANTWPEIAYEYVEPDLIEKVQQGVLNEYVYIFRAYLLITPEGPVYLGARKDISAFPVPDALSYGAVENKNAYIANLKKGDYSEPHEDSEDTACKNAILSIGNVIHTYLIRKYKLTIADG